MSLAGATLIVEVSNESKQAIDTVAQFGTAAIKGTRRGLGKGMLIAQNRATRNAAGGNLTSRTSVLARSVKGFVRDGEDGFPVGVLGVVKGLADRYAAAQEVGTRGKGGLLPDIVPRNAKALAVPLQAAKDKRGVPLFTGPKDPAIAGRLFMIERPGRPPILAAYSAQQGENQTKRGGGEHIIPMFILLRRVALRPRNYLRDALRDSTAEIMDHVNRGIAEELSKR